MKGRVYCILFLLLGSYALPGQTLPDSVQQFLAITPKDSAYIVRLNKLAFTFIKSKPEICRELAAQSMEFAQAINFTRGYARALNITGSSYWVVGDYESALDYYHLSAREAGAVNDSVGISEAYHNMGEVYKKLGDHEKAIEFLNTSMQWDKKQNVNRDITLYNIGEAYYFLGNYAEASNYFERALSMAIKENDARTLAYAYTGMGLIKYKYKEYYPAMAYYTKAEALWKEQGEIRSLIQTYQDFHDVFLEPKHYDKAQEYIEKAIQMAREIKSPDLQISNYLRETELFARQGKHELALGVLRKHIALKDSMYNEKRSEQIARLQTLFETEARDIENQQLKATQSLLDAQIKTRNLLIITISGGLLAAGFLAYIFFRQRGEISKVNNLLLEKNAEINEQKGEIENQTLELKSLNDQLQDLNKSLEGKIEERTRQLTWQNKKLAEYAHANAHQLRAPVVSILGLLNLIEKIHLPEEDKTLISHLQKCGRELDQITRTINRNLEEEKGLPEVD